MKNRKTKLALLLAAVLVLSTGCGKTETPALTQGATQAVTQPAPEKEKVASASDMAPVEDVVEADMTPVSGTELKDGVYSVIVDSSSSMFKITHCELTVEGGQMTARMYMGGTGYLKVFPGTGAEAAAAEEAAAIPFEEAEDGTHTFTIPVEALDKGIACAAYSKNKEMWYDRTLVFRADSLPLEVFRDSAFATVESLGLADGSYTVQVRLEGGSGKASVESPAALRVEDGQAWVTLVWSSPNYDYMRLGEEKYLPRNTQGNAEFEIPVTAFDFALPVMADTTAMSTPHEIAYTLYFDSATLQPAS